MKCWKVKHSEERGNLLAREQGNWYGANRLDGRDRTYQVEIRLKLKDQRRKGGAGKMPAKGVMCSEVHPQNPLN
jgi:hypothetical protein